jgi:hypothetical protein
MPWAPLSLLLRDMVGFEEIRFGLAVGCVRVWWETSSSLSARTTVICLKSRQVAGNITSYVIALPTVFCP